MIWKIQDYNKNNPCYFVSLPLHNLKREDKISMYIDQKNSFVPFFLENLVKEYEISVIKSCSIALVVPTK